MKAVLLRTGLWPVKTSSLAPQKAYPFDKDSGTGISFFVRNFTALSRSVHFQVRSKKKISSCDLRRTVSDTEVIHSELSTAPRIHIRSTQAKIAEKEDLQLQSVEKAEKEEGSPVLKLIGFDLGVSDVFAGDDVLVEELEFSGGGMGKGKEVGGRRGGGRGGDENESFSGGNSDQNKIGAYYQQMLMANPENPLLLSNFGRYLHEVKKDYRRAEDYYGRAILASPGEGEVLSLYANLIWESQRDQARAKSYFDQAIKACPDDCYILGSYALFTWEEEEEEEEREKYRKLGFLLGRGFFQREQNPFRVGES